MTLQTAGFTNTQQPSGMPFHRYRAFPPIDLPDRTWPTQTDHPGAALAVAPTCATATRR